MMERSIPGDQLERSEPCPGATRRRRRASTTSSSKAKALTGLERLRGRLVARRASRCWSGRRRPRPASTSSASRRSYASLVKPLVNRLQVEDWYTRHPEIDEQEVAIELLGVGLPAHRLDRAVAPARRGPGVPHPAHLGGDRRPCPPPGVSPEDDEARIAGRARCGRHGARPHRGAAALDAAAVGDGPDGGPRPDGPRVHRADLPRGRAHPDLRRLVRATATWSRRTATRSAC